MRRALTSGQLNIPIFFITVILAGSALLSLPASWAGGDGLSYLDALFTSTSAVCVTGLITVDTARYSLLGKLVIVLLIQAGGLGIMSLATLYLTNPRRRISFLQARFIRDYYVETVPHQDREIVRNILLFTLLFEAAGALVLFARFAPLARSGQGLADGPLFTAVFHSVSAFCNAGFSLFSNNLESFPGDPAVLLPIATLIVAGGLGFVVVQDLADRLRGRGRGLSLHSRVVLGMTLLLVCGGAALYYLFERGAALGGLGEPGRILNAFFQSITPRTAGFNALPQARLSAPSKALTLFLMFTGAGPGSIAGGVKVTTLFLVLLAVMKGTRSNGTLDVGRRQIAAEIVTRAQLFVLRAVSLLALSVFALCVSELTVPGTPWTFLDVLFESVSAFGTVGLSLGITPALTPAGKLIIILTMFAGRVGLITIAIAQPLPAEDRTFEYASEKILVG